jgi:hypothetical protein
MYLTEFGHLCYLLLCFPEANQEKIVEAGGLGSLLNLLQSSEDETIRRVAAGAVANLAMNGDASYPSVILFLTNSLIGVYDLSASALYKLAHSWAYIFCWQDSSPVVW